jgi:hypothetical protein
MYIIHYNTYNLIDRIKPINQSVDSSVVDFYTKFCEKNEKTIKCSQVIPIIVVRKYHTCIK